jgi:hypothetical protein
MSTAARSVLVLLVLLIGACRSRQAVVQAPRELPVRSAEKLIERLSAQRLDGIRYYSAKAEVDINGPDGHQGFKATLRSVLDSAAWISITPALGIEVARALLTTDSLKVLDKLHDQYWVGDTTAARTRFGLQPSLDLFQKALFGLPIGLEPEEKYKADREDGQYVLTSKEKKRFRRAAEDLAPEDTLANDRDMRENRLERTLRRAERKDAVVYRYWIEPDSFLVTRVLISDLGRDQQADVRYLHRTDVNGHALPDHITLSLSDSTKQVSAAFQLDRIGIDGPLQLNFRIPEKFTPMP